MKQISTEAIILKRINFSEADRIITAITNNQGRLSLLAKGVRKPKSKLAGGLELFSVSEITFIDGKSELKTIISTRLKNHYSNIVKDVNKTMSAYDFLKATESTTQHGVETGVYDILENSLNYLNLNNSDGYVANIWFTAKLLSAEGGAINIEKPMNGAKFSDETNYDFSYDDMAFLVNEKGLFSPKHIKFIRLVYRADNPEKLHLVQDFETLASDFNQTLTNLLKLHKA